MILKKFFTHFLEVLCSTVHDRSNSFITLSFLLIILSSSCLKHEDDLITHLRNNYANLEINDPKNKKRVIGELEELLRNNNSVLSLTDIRKIQLKLNEINDGHVVLYDQKGEFKQGHGPSGLLFFPGSVLVRSCADCDPVLPEEKYQIEMINQLPLADWLRSYRYHVAASSEWGREYRLIRQLLNEQLYEASVVITLKNSRNKRITTTVYSKKNKVGSSDSGCVSGKRLSEKIYHLIVRSLWCDQKNPRLSRKEVLNNFVKEWKTAIEPVSPRDKIILDLRDNGGGGDDEVKEVIRTFFHRSVYMDQYQYLARHQPGWKKWTALTRRWAEAVDEYIDPETNAGKLSANKLIALVSAGCFSSCETIASILKLEKRALLIGKKTHGGAGDPRLFPVADSRFSINLPVCVVRQKDKKYFEGNGVQPDKLSTQKTNSTADSVLQQAINLLH